MLAFAAPAIVAAWTVSQDSRVSHRNSYDCSVWILFYATLIFITSYFEWQITPTSMDANGGCAEETAGGSDDTAFLF